MAAALLWPGIIGGGMLADLIMNLVGDWRKTGTERKGIDLQKLMLSQTANQGRREELRGDKLMKQLVAERDKESRRERGFEERAGMRQSMDQENQMAMALIAALSGMNQRTSEIASRPPPSRMSMVGLLR